ncbi:MAG: hydrogenase iron-sulfur subunit [Desulfobacteraceae bacterium]|nr:hydrogenase iron-sulfur subunit [Desulfobacteraceae bacterium]
MAGVSRLQYTNENRLIRVMCSGRVDLEFILRAFSNGQDGVFIGGCRLNECNYITHGNFDALTNVYLCRKIMKNAGLNPERLRIEFMSGSDGILLTEVINDFTKKVKDLGPLGKGEGTDEKGLKFKLEAARKLVPYIRLVERERLRMPKSEEAYDKFFTSDEFDGLFDELILNKLAISQIMLLLKEKPLSTGEISETLGLNPSEVSRHMNSSSRHGFVRYDTSSNRYALA